MCGQNIQTVSVPLPGFSGLRHGLRIMLLAVFIRFSPVAGIQWVETPTAKRVGTSAGMEGFSPVAGIQWVETLVYLGGTPHY